MIHLLENITQLLINQYKCQKQELAEFVVF